MPTHDDIDDADDSTDLLPSTTTYPDVRPITPLPATATEKELIQDDIEVFNSSARIVDALWKTVSTPAQALALVNQNLKMIKDRRDILGKAYGANKSTPAKTDVFEPIP